MKQVTEVLVCLTVCVLLGVFGLYALGKDMYALVMLSQLGYVVVTTTFGVRAKRQGMSPPLFFTINALIMVVALGFSMVYMFTHLVP